MKIIKTILIYIIGTISFLAATLDLYNGLPVIKKMIETAMTTVSGEAPKPNSDDKLEAKQRSKKNAKKSARKSKTSSRKAKSSRKNREAAWRQREQERIEKQRREREEQEREAARYERARQRLEKAKRDLEQEQLEADRSRSRPSRYDDYDDDNDQPTRPSSSSPRRRSTQQSPVERLRDSRSDSFDEMGDALRRRR